MLEPMLSDGGPLSRRTRARTFTASVRARCSGEASSTVQAVNAHTAAFWFLYSATEHALPFCALLTSRHPCVRYQLLTSRTGRRTDTTLVENSGIFKPSSIEPHRYRHNQRLPGLGLSDHHTLRNDSSRRARSLLPREPSALSREPQQPRLATLTPNPRAPQ